MTSLAVVPTFVQGRVKLVIWMHIGIVESEVQTSVRLSFLEILVHQNGVFLGLRSIETLEVQGLYPLHP